MSKRPGKIRKSRVPVKYMSKDDAYALYKKLNKDNPLLLEMVTTGYSSASLEIYAKKPTYLPEICQLFKYRERQG